LPGNFYGAHGDFNPASAPLVNALIANAEAVRTGAASSLQVLGSGRAREQIMHASDLARIMLWAVFNLDQDTPLLVAGEECSVEEIACLVSEATGMKGSVVFADDQNDGALRWTADTSEFNRLCPNFAFMPLADGLSETIAWFRSQSSTTSAGSTCSVPSPSMVKRIGISSLSEKTRTDN
jgi:nucleoside-diphosphate-sugar epimerase